MPSLICQGFGILDLCLATLFNSDQIARFKRADICCRVWSNS
jgi:hypothetical protein